MTDPTPISVTDSIKQTNQTTHINETSISLIAQPKTVWKIIRALNHWIDNLVTFYEPKDQINEEQPWYKQWKGIYRLIKSSKTTYIHVYQLMLNDYSPTTESTTVTQLIEYLLNTIPRLSEYATISTIEGQERNQNYFNFELKLFYNEMNDDNNKFNDMRSKDSRYKPFTDNESLCTWHTLPSQKSTISDTGSKSIPKIVHTQPSNEDHQSQQEGQKSGFTNQSLSPNIMSNSELQPKLNLRVNKNIKKSEELKTLVTTACKEEIRNEMTTIREEMSDLKVDLQSTLEAQTKQLESMLCRVIPSTASPPSPIATSQQATIPPLYRRSMPSPRPDMHKFNFSRDDIKEEPLTHESDKPAPTGQRTYQRAGAYVFDFEGNSYELRDGDFSKYTANLITVNSSNDLITYYKQLQAMAVTYNIFLREFHELTPWNRSENSIPSTCLFTIIDVPTKTIDAYRRMKSVLYSKILKSEFNHPEHKAIIAHGSEQQDGFEILYDLMTQCHPKLASATRKYRVTNHRPDMGKNDSVYEYVKQLHNWMEIEKIDGHNYDNDQILNIVMEQLRADTRYDLAVASIQSELTLRDTFQRQYGASVFPEGLTLRNLPGTIMSYYSDDEKRQLFPTPSSNTSVINVLHSQETTDDAIVRSMRDNTSFARKSIDKLCGGCGKYGHDIFKSGCDFCAQHLIASEFFKKYPKASNKILEQYREHQLQRQKQRRNNESNGSKGYNQQKPRYNLRNKNKKATVRMLQDVITGMLDESSDDDVSDNNGDHFEDAQENGDDKASEDATTQE
jgi:hypothetical protein